MKIKRLVLENFGLFRGHNEIDLDTRAVRGKVKPIVLIGGKNGAGKTSILEAIRLCLYGPQGIADRISAKGYEQYLRGRVHRDDGLLIKPTSAAVTLVFEHAHIGAKHEFTVTRSWDVKENGVTSSLEVLRDGVPLDDIDRENAEEFLRDLVPPGVAQLYFFDGEKIQELAEAEDVDAALSEAIKNLLGLELVDRLQADLRIYRNRIDIEGTNADVVNKIDAIDVELNKKRNELIELRKSLDEATSHSDSIRKDIARQEARIAKEGGAYANRREELEIQRRSHAARLTELENEIRRHAENLLPFTIVPQLCDQVEAQLSAERKLQEWIAIEKIVEERGHNLKSKLEKLLRQEEKTIGAELARGIEMQIDSALKDFVEKPQELNNLTIIHDLSSDQQTRILNGIGRARNDIPLQLEKLKVSLEKEARALLKAEQALKKVPSEDQLKPMVEAINDLNQQLGASLSIMRLREAAVASADFAIKELERNLDKAEKLQRESGKLQEKQSLAERVQAVLDEYHNRLLKSKSSELSEALAKRFSQLWRKGDRAKRIEINPLTYEVVLYDRHDRVVPKKELSAGEKQIYAIAILWALADVSGRPLPMVIDTPLGRLDGDHRNHLVERYFPHASHQVIILSTDTEIDEEYFNELSPSVSHAIHLQYLIEDARTKIEDGYFWKRRSNSKELTFATQ
jgi:DNA sulfur modification protein DndD